MKPYIFLSALVMGVFVFPAVSMSQEADAEAEAVEPSDAAVSEKTRSAMIEVREAAQRFVEDLTPEQERHFGVLYGNYNLIKVVKTVRDDLGNAMDSCGEENPDIKEEASTRYDEWTEAIDPVLEDAEANVANMIVAQDYARPREFDQFFKLVDKARDQNSQDVQKVPVTSLEACQTMISKMDETQPNMIELLNATLVSLPKALQEEKQKAEEEAAKKAAEEAEKAAEEAVAEDADEESEETAEDDAE